MSSASLTPTLKQNNVYLTSVELAELMGCSRRWISDLAEIYGAISISGNGGSGSTSYRFPLGNLPPEVQQKWREKYASKTRIKTAYELAPEWICERADYRKNILDDWDKWCEKYPNRTKEQNFPDFAAKYQGKKLSLASLYKWQKAYRQKGMDGLLGKVPSRPTRKIHPEAWKRFCDLYLRPQRLSISACYDIVSLEAAENGWYMPTLRTFDTAVQEDIPFAVKSVRRYGAKDCYDNAAPYTRRDPESIAAGQVYVGDHHVLDLMVIHNGRPVRPWLTAWLDMRSHKFVGWTVALSPCTDTIMASFAKAALDPAIGLPREIYIDNGRDYCSHKFAGRGHRGKPLTESDQEKLIIEGKRTQTLMNRFDIKTHFAIVENARAKVIERAFKDVVERFSKLYPTYCGRNTAERPEDHSDILKALVKNSQKGRVVLTLDDIREDMDIFIRQIWNKTKSPAGRGRQMESPDETFERTRLPVRRAPEEAMRLLFMKSNNPRKIGRNGITFRGEEYYNPEFVLLRGQSVYFRWQEDDLSRIFVYSTKDEYLGTAHKVEALPAVGADPEVLAAEMQRKAQAMKRIKEHPLTVSSKKAKAPSISELADLFGRHRKPAPDPQPTKIIEVVQVPDEVRQSVRRMKASGESCDINPFEAMLSGTAAELRRKELRKKYQK